MLARLRDTAPERSQGELGADKSIESSPSIVSGDPSRLLWSARFRASTTDAALAVPTRTIRQVVGAACFSSRAEGFGPGTPAVLRRAMIHLKELTGARP